MTPLDQLQVQFETLTEDRDIAAQAIRWHRKKIATLRETLRGIQRGLLLIESIRDAASDAEPKQAQPQGG
jgi:hypothetical protein